MLISTITTDLTTPPYTTYQSSGPTTGGNQIIITGTDLVPNPTTHSTTSDYAATPTIHYDAIDNLGTGDANHSSTTTTWVNLGSLGSARNMPLANISIPATPASGWTSKSLIFDGINDYGLSTPNYTLSQITLESVARVISYHSHAFGVHAHLLQNHIYGGTYLTCEPGSNSYCTLTLQSCSNTSNCDHYGVSVSTPNQFATHSISGTYNQLRATTRLNFSTNSNFFPSIDISQKGSLGVMLGGDTPATIYDNIEVFSARIYSRALSTTEQFQNCWVDKYRFNLPDDTCLKITLGTADITSTCTIISTSQITCTAPPHTDGYTNITINNGIENTTMSNAYLYRDFTISLGTPSQPITFTIPPDNTITTTTQSITASTNYLDGYTLTIQMSTSNNSLTFTDQKGTPHYLEPTNPSTHPTTLSPNSWGLKLTETSYIPIPPKNQPYIIKSTTTANTSPDTIPITFAARADINQIAGEYKGTILYTLTTN